MQILKGKASLYGRLKSKLYDNNEVRLIYHKYIKNYFVKSSVRDFALDKQEISKSLKEMRKLEEKHGKRILVSGHIGLSPRTPFLAKVASFLGNGYELILLIENEADYKRLREKKWKGVTEGEYVRLKQFIAPSLFMKDVFYSYQKAETDREGRELIKEKEYLSEAVENLRKRHFDMTEGYVRYFVVQSYRYIRKVLEILQPDCVMLWNQFFAFHHIFEGICKEQDTKCIYFEFGVLPGTYAVEMMGQMGESYPAFKYKEFRELVVSREELDKAKEICLYIKNNKVNRKVQPKNDIWKVLSKKLTQGVPTIFYAGQNDFESGICPYTGYTKKYHSPVFKSSDEAVFYLASLAKKNGWNLIYKMHPLVSKFCLPASLPRNVILLNYADINDLIQVSNVTITILSQTGYVALFNEKPVLMLGYTQLRGKGCTYEAFRKEDIERRVKDALQYGYTKEQKENYQKHIAQIAKYYVFNDKWFDKKIDYGRDMQDCAELLRQYVEGKDCGMTVLK